MDAVGCVVHPSLSQMLNVLLLLAGVADVSWAAVRDPAASWSTVTSVNESQSVSTPASTLTRSEFMKIIMRGASKYNGGKSAKAMQKARHRARRRRLLLLEQGAMCEADRPLWAMFWSMGQVIRIEFSD